MKHVISFLLFSILGIYSVKCAELCAQNKVPGSNIHAQFISDRELNLTTITNPVLYMRLYEPQRPDIRWGIVNVYDPAEPFAISKKITFITKKGLLYEIRFNGTELIYYNSPSCTAKICSFLKDYLRDLKNGNYATKSYLPSYNLALIGSYAATIILDTMLALSTEKDLTLSLTSLKKNHALSCEQKEVLLHYTFSEQQVKACVDFLKNNNTFIGIQSLFKSDSFVTTVIQKKTILGIKNKAVFDYGANQLISSIECKKDSEITIPYISLTYTKSEKNTQYQNKFQTIVYATAPPQKLGNRSIVLDEIIYGKSPLQYIQKHLPYLKDYDTTATIPEQKTTDPVALIDMYWSLYLRKLTLYFITKALQEAQFNDNIPPQKMHLQELSKITLEALSTITTAMYIIGEGGLFSPHQEDALFAFLMGKNTLEDMSQLFSNVSLKK